MKSAILLITTLFLSFSIQASQEVAAGGSRDPEPKAEPRDPEPKGGLYEFFDNIFTPPGLEKAAAEKQRQYEAIEGNKGEYKTPIKDDSTREFIDKLKKRYQLTENESNETICVISNQFGRCLQSKIRVSK